MIPAAVLLACPNLAVPARLMYHVAMVESDANQYAIGVVGGRLLRQPVSLDEATVTARSLEAQGYNFSVGVAQVNHANLKKYGLDTYEKAFSICGNLLVGSRILAQCYSDAGGIWGKAFSCYYSGDFTAGYRDGYVQRVLTSLSRGGPVDRVARLHSTSPISVLPPATAATTHARDRTLSPGRAAYRVAIRTSFLDAAANAVVTRVAPKLSPTDPKDALRAGAVLAGPVSVPLAQEVAEVTRAPIGLAGSPVSSAMPATAGSSAGPGPARAPGAQETKVFVPQVVDLKNPTRQGPASDTQASSAVVASSTSPGDSVDTAFVF